MKSRRRLISIVDDDESIRQSLPYLLAELGFAAHAFASAEEYLESEDLHQTDCLILDNAMPGMTGPELQSELTIRKLRTPVIFITAQTDEELRPHLLSLGAVDYLLKPFSEADLQKALDAAFRPK